MEKGVSLLSAGWRRARAHLARLAVLPMVGALVLGPALTAHAVAPTATVCLLSSTGAATPGANAEYHAGTWRSIGQTGADGCASTSDAAAAANTYFRVSLGGQSQTVTQNTTASPVVTFRTIATTVRFLDSTGAAIPGGAAEYYAGTWKPFGTTDATGNATRELMTGSTYFRIAFGGQSQTVTQNPGTNPVVTFTTIATTARFIDSAGAPVVGAPIEYYAGTWKPFGTTDATGAATRELITGSTYFRAFLGGQNQQVTQNPGTNPVVTFTTVATVVRFLDSTGAGIAGAPVEYYAGTWKPFGTTDATGTATRQLITGSTYFRVFHGGQSHQITQNTSADPVVTFRTLATTARFTNSLGAGIAGAPVEYYAGTWKPFGTTDATGTATRELLIGSTYFRISHLGLSQQVTQNPGTNPLVAFQTGRVLQGVGTAVTQWYGSGWKSFATGIEILPGSTSFRLADGRTHVATVVAGRVTYVPSAPTAPVVTAGTDLAITEGGTAVLAPATFTDLEPGARHSATILWGDGSAAEAGVVAQVDGLAGTVAASHTYADNGTYTVRVCVTDDLGPTAQGCAELQVVVTNVAPTLTLSPVVAPVAEGTLVTIEATTTDPGTTDEVSATWTVSHDGATVAAGEGLTPAFTPQGDGAYRVGVTATDGDGGTTTAEVVVTVINVAPTLSLPTAPEDAREGSPVSITGTVSDPGTADEVVTGWTVTRDEHVVASGSGVSADFTPTNEGTYRVSVTADDGVTSVTAEVAVMVSNVAPTVTLPEPPDAIAEGTPVVLEATVTDPGEEEVHTSWSVSLDGSPFASGIGTDVLFVPKDEGTYRVTLIADDGDGGRVVAGAFLTIALPALPAPVTQLGGSAVTTATATATATAATKAAPATRSTAARAAAAVPLAASATPEAAETAAAEAPASLAGDAAAAEPVPAAEADVAEAGAGTTEDTDAGTAIETSEVVAPAAEVLAADDAEARANGLQPEPVLTSAGSTWAALSSRVPMLAWVLTPLLALVLSTGIARVRVRLG